MRALRALGWLGLAASIGCSATTVSRTACESTDDCRGAFGAGFVCASGGLCAQASVNPRCDRFFPDDLLTRRENYTSTVVLGALLDREDPTDAASELAIRLAAQQVNERGGVGGRTFGVVFCTTAVDASLDTARTREDAARTTARYLATEWGTPAILGPATSGQVQAAYEALRDTRTLIVSHSATSPALTTLDPPGVGLLWRTAVPDSLQGQVIAADMRARNVRRVAVIVERGPYGDALNSIFTAVFTDATRTTESFPYGDATERSSQTLAVSRRIAEFDEVLFISSSFADPPRFLIEASTLGTFGMKGLFFSDSAGTQEFVNSSISASSLFMRVRGTRPSRPQGDVFDAFRSAYRSANPMGPDPLLFPYAAFAYDAAWLVFAGTAWGLSRGGEPLDGAGIAAGLRHVSDLSSNAVRVDLLPGDWARVVAQFQMARDVDVRGASGELDYDPLTEETKGALELWTIGPVAGAPAGVGIVVQSTVQPM